MMFIALLLCIFSLAALLTYVVRKQQQKPAVQPAVYTFVLGLALAGGISAFVLQHGSQLPDATLVTLDEQDTALESYLDGRPMVVNLWASWCPPCVREMPLLQDAERNYEDVRFIFVNQREHLDTVRTFLHQQGLTLDTVLLDSSGDFSAMVGAQVMPTTLFFNAEGVLQKRYFGEVDDEVLAQGLGLIQQP